jgi:hypothetical protein
VYRVDVRVVRATNVGLLELDRQSSFDWICTTGGDFSDCDAAVAQASGRCAGAGGTFSGEAIDGSGRATKIFDGCGVASLQVAAWAGNVRELRTLSGTMTKVDNLYITYLYRL